MTMSCIISNFIKYAFIGNDKIVKPVLVNYEKKILTSY